MTISCLLSFTKPSSRGEHHEHQLHKLAAKNSQALVPRGHHEHQLPKLSCRVDRLSIRCYSSSENQEDEHHEHQLLTEENPAGRAL